MTQPQSTVQPPEGSMTFEEAISRLEQIVQQMESGQLSLEDSLGKFEEGMRLSKLCRDKLTQVQGKIEQLVPRAGNPNPQWEPYNGPMQG